MTRVRSTRPGPERRAASPLLLAALIGGALALAGCGGGSRSPSRTFTVSVTTPRTTITAPPAPPRPAPPPLAVTAPAFTGSAWTPVATVRGRTAAWMSQRGPVTLLRFDQSLTTLALHAGSSEPGGAGWRYGDTIDAGEIHHVIAGFNGGFKLTYGHVGFVSYGRVATPLSSGLGSIVTYADGTTQIGAWREGVPAAGKAIASVRQNLTLMIDHGRASPTVESCPLSCWGETLGGGVSVARSALGVDREGRLVWGAGESLTPGQLATALVAADVQRAVELDINPFWVAGYLYEHRPSGPVAVPVVPGQHGIEGQLLGPDRRDFFAVSAR